LSSTRPESSIGWPHSSTFYVASWGDPKLSHAMVGL
jgi:hypothetical protein